MRDDIPSEHYDQFLIIVTRDSDGIPVSETIYGLHNLEITQTRESQPIYIMGLRHPVDYAPRAHETEFRGSGILLKNYTYKEEERYPKLTGKLAALDL